MHVQKKTYRGFNTICSFRRPLGSWNIPPVNKKRLLYYILFIPSSVGEHLSCLQFLASLKNTAINICLQVFVWTDVFISFEQILLRHLTFLFFFLFSSFLHVVVLRKYIDSVPSQPRSLVLKKIFQFNQEVNIWICCGIQQTSIFILVSDSCSPLDPVPEGNLKVCSKFCARNEDRLVYME